MKNWVLENHWIFSQMAHACKITLLSSVPRTDLTLPYVDPSVSKGKRQNKTRNILGLQIGNSGSYLIYWKSKISIWGLSFTHPPPPSLDALYTNGGSWKWCWSTGCPMPAPIDRQLRNNSLAWSPCYVHLYSVWAVLSKVRSWASSPQILHCCWHFIDGVVAWRLSHAFHFVLSLHLSALWVLYLPSLATVGTL